MHDWDNNTLSTLDYIGQVNKELERIRKEATRYNFTQFHHFPGQTEENNKKHVRTAEIWTFNLLRFSLGLLLLSMILRPQPLVVSSKCGSIRCTSLHCEQLNYDLLCTCYSVFLPVKRMHNFRVVLATPWIMLLRWRHLPVQGVLKVQASHKRMLVFHYQH
jgi:hypothetical protein